MFRLLIVFLVALPLLPQNIQVNVKHYMQLIHIDFEQFKVIGFEKDGHAIYLSPKHRDEDPIKDSLSTVWEREISGFAYLLHGTKTGYRYPIDPSLNIHVHEDSGLVYEVDIDRYCTRNVFDATRHFYLEVLPHWIFHTSTSEPAITKLMQQGKFLGEIKRITKPNH